MRSRTCGLVVSALMVACNGSEKNPDGSAGSSGTGGMAASAGMAASGGTSGAAAGTGGASASSGSAGAAGRAPGTGGTSGGQGGTSGGAGASAGKDPNILVEQPEAINELELDASRVYWVEDHNRILSLPLEGGTPSVVYASNTPDEFEILHISIDAERAYISDQGNRNLQKPRGVFSVPLDGSAEREQLITTDSVAEIAVGGDFVYFLANGGIARMPKSGGAATMLITAIGYDTPLVVHEGYVYFWYQPGTSSNVDVYRVAVDADAGPLVNPSAGGSGGTGGAPSGEGGAPSTGIESAEQVSDTTRYSQLILAPKVDEGYLYWGIYDELYRFPVAGGEQEKFGMLEFGTSLQHMLVDHGNVYWASGSVNEYLVEETTTVIVSTKQGVTDFAVNDSSIFVADGKYLRKADRPKR